MNQQKHVKSTLATIYKRANMKRKQVLRRNGSHIILV